MFGIGFLCGFALATFLFLWGRSYCYHLYSRLTDKRYPVLSYSLLPEKDGVFLMRFAFSNNEEITGYTKKCLPMGLRPEDLEVKILSALNATKMNDVFSFFCVFCLLCRNMCIGRCRYNVFYSLTSLPISKNCFALM